MINFKKLLNIKNLTKIALTAAVYSALTLFLAPLSYGQIQLRFAEVLNLLAFINPIYGIGVVLGCLISNMASPYGMLDVVVGTFATTLAVMCIIKSKKLFIATLWPTIFCFLIGPVITGLDAALITMIIVTLWVMAGQFIVVTIIGYPLFNSILKNKALVKILKE